MFQQLSDRLGAALDAVRGKGRLTDDNIQAALRAVRMALLEADVALPVVKTFIEQVRTRALGEEVTRSLTPGQMLVKIVHQELVRVMGGEAGAMPLDLAARPPVVVLLAGLQGAGKTTSAAKLARRLRERERKKVLLVSADVYRPAAIDQLERLAGEVDAGFIRPASDQPLVIAETALQEARARHYDVLIIDTAGRLHIDTDLMIEVRALHAAVTPVETLFVVDAMSGQDAVNAAWAFGAALPLTGVILTKADGDARGGAALSVRQVTGQPIKFIGLGEKSTALEPFDPERMASRILGMGDVLSLVEDVERNVDRAKAEKLARKVQQGKGFDLADFRDQLQQMLGMGGMHALLDKLPGASKLPVGARAMADDKTVKRQVAIINAMTPTERRRPDILNGSRRRRIATGSGTQVQDVNRLLKQYAQMQTMMKRFAKGGMAKLMRGLGGRLPF